MKNVEQRLYFGLGYPILQSFALGYASLGTAALVSVFSDVVTCGDVPGTVIGQSILVLIIFVLPFPLGPMGWAIGSAGLKVFRITAMMPVVGLIAAFLCITTAEYLTMEAHRAHCTAHGAPDLGHSTPLTRYIYKVGAVLFAVSLISSVVTWLGVLWKPSGALLNASERARQSLTAAPPPGAACR